MEESSVRYRTRSMADLLKETKRKTKGNSTPRSPFILRKIKRSKIMTPRRCKSLCNKRIEMGKDSFELDSVADIDNSATSLCGTGRDHASTNIDNSPQEQFNLDPLQEMLTMMRHQEHSISYFHENRKLALAEECERELKEVRKKYSVLVQNEEAVCNQRLNDVKELQHALQKNRIFAELYRSNLTENYMHGNLELEVQAGTSCSVQQHTRPPAPSQHLHSSSRMSTRLTRRMDDLIQKLPKLNISKIPISPSPLSSAPVQPVHSSPPRMDPPSSLAVHSPQGQKGNLMQKLRKTDISKMSISPSPSSSALPFPFPPPGFPPPSSVVQSTSVVSSASNGRTMSQNNLTSQVGQDQSVLGPLTIRLSSMGMPSTMPTASNVCFRAPAPHLRQYRPI